MLILQDERRSSCSEIVSTTLKTDHRDGAAESGAECLTSMRQSTRCYSVEDGLTITFLNFEIIGDSNLHTSFPPPRQSRALLILSLSLLFCACWLSARKFQYLCSITGILVLNLSTTSHSGPRKIQNPPSCFRPFPPQDSPPHLPPGKPRLDLVLRARERRAPRHRDVALDRRCPLRLRLRRVHLQYLPRDLVREARLAL